MTSSTCSATLATGASCTIQATRTVQAGDPDPLPNTVTVHYNPDGFPNNITACAAASCTVTPGLEGCTPGFWQGGYGRNLWNEPTDPDWPDRTGEGGTATNPFTHDTLFCDYFGCKVGTKLAGLTMIEIVGTGGGEMPERKAARNVIAAYLNTAWSMRHDFGLYDEPGEIAALWTSAVSGGISYMDVRLLLGGYNNQECPIP